MCFRWERRVGGKVGCVLSALCEVKKCYNVKNVVGICV
jgi:hypothetical protein